MIPAGLESQRRLGPQWGTWLDALPRTRDEVLDEWGLTPDGEPLHGYCSLVLPVGTPDGGAAVLKIGLPDEESEHEHLALQRWGGDGAVRLLRADPRRRAMLLERLHATTLADLWDLEACEVVAGLWTRLHVPAMPQLRPLTAYVARWGADLADLPRNAPVPRRMVEQALALGRDLGSDEASTGIVVHTDLHYDNVLAADREPWLAIDPKPLDGDPHYEVAPMLWNRWEELAGDLRGGVRRRFHTLVDAGGLDEDRARDWVVVRMVHNAMWAVRDAERAGRALEASEREWITRCIALVKAVQD